MDDGVVGIELARRQAFQIQIGLDLGMELLVGAVVFDSVMMSSGLMSRLVHQPESSITGTSRRWPFLSMVRSVT